MIEIVDSKSQRAPPSGGVRFAPSPTGRFHVGNLRTAWISFQFSRALKLPWVVRIEDIDAARVLPEARQHQLEDMSELGLVPDLLLTQSLYQSRHSALFRDGVLSGQIYACDCSRKDVQTALAELQSAPHDGVPAVYSGTCRTLESSRELQATESIAWRFRAPDSSGQDDFIVARSNLERDTRGLPVTFAPSYHWACAIDDFDGRYELLVRASDLRHALIPQRMIQEWLGAREGIKFSPAVFHCALITQDDGHRLEKRTTGVTLPELQARGVDAEELAKIFERSFERNLLAIDFTAGGVFEESKEKLSVTDLRL